MVAMVEFSTLRVVEGDIPIRGANRDHFFEVYLFSIYIYQKDICGDHLFYLLSFFLFFVLFCVRGLSLESKAAPRQKEFLYPTNTKVHLTVDGSTTHVRDLRFRETSLHLTDVL
jgi:hypothetical protein